MLLKKMLKKTNFHEKPPRPTGLGLLLIWVYFLFWLGCVVFLYWYWQELSGWIKYPIALLEALFAPDVSIFEDLFRRNKRR